MDEEKQIPLTRGQLKELFNKVFWMTSLQIIEALGKHRRGEEPVNAQSEQVKTEAWMNRILDTFFTGL